jgi:hypothetical protein
MHEFIVKPAENLTKSLALRQRVGLDCATLEASFIRLPIKLPILPNDRVSRIVNKLADHQECLQTRPESQPSKESLKR